ncbi:glycosyltransferase [Candidatus Pelagibacter sp.]|nr:glycosyltransferase [Candidatus Pelagibacter sp.]
MIIGIDASTIKSDGGVEHLSQILNKFKFNNKIKKIYIWSSKKNLRKIRSTPQIIKINNFFLNSNIIFKIIWQLFFFNKEIRSAKCDLLLLCSGYQFSKKICKRVILFQNILPFLKNDIKNKILKFLYSKANKTSDGTIFLSKYCKKLISKKINITNNNRVIYHGVDEIYFKKPRLRKKSNKKIINLAYVSSISHDKNQLNLLEALVILSKKNYFFKLYLLGPLDQKIKKLFYKKIYMIKKFNKIIHKKTNSKKMIKKILEKTDISVYPSKHETFGISLLESMANSQVICCSNRSTMPELLKDGGLYFNPESPINIARCIEILIKNKKLGHSLAQKSFNIALKFSWKKCSVETFNFLYDISKKKNSNN